MIIRLLWPKILIAVVTCLLVGFLGSLPTMEALESWYPSLIKPSFNPPNWLFAPVWTSLYILMGISVALIWHAGWQKQEVQGAVMLFLAQLVLNGFRSVVFFGTRSIVAALVIILILWVLIGLCVWRFYPIRKLASYLLWPYWLWVSFATILNFSLYWLNK